MNYISIRLCDCTHKITCLIHRPNYNYSFLEYTLEDILSIESISYKEYITILNNKNLL